MIGHHSTFLLISTKATTSDSSKEGGLAETRVLDCIAYVRTSSAS
jgi:hypothetical protein